jgi:DNA-binding response OmpR family regulator
MDELTGAPVQKTIFIIDDSPTEIAVLKEYLSEGNYRLFTFTNGFTAINALQAHVPDIILTDVVMPEIDGFQICSILKKLEKTKHVPIVIFTAIGDPAHILKGLYSGANNFIIKPFTREYLLAQIETILNLVSLQTFSSKDGYQIEYDGSKYTLTPERMQIVNLLLSTFDVMVRKNRELEEANARLRNAHNEIETLQQLIPICAKCKKIRNDKGFWEQVESYIQQRTNSDFTHTLCPDCDHELYNKT